MLSDPANQIKTKFKGEPSVVAFMGVFNPPELKPGVPDVFTRDVKVKFRYMSETAENYGKVLYETEIDLAAILSRKSPFAGIIGRDKDLEARIKTVITAKPARKDSAYHMVVSRRAADFMRSSTCQQWGSCLMLSEPDWSNGANLGMFYDFGAYIAYLAGNEFSPKWLTRVTIMPVNPKRKRKSGYDPDAKFPCGHVQTFKGPTMYKNILHDALSELFFQKGLNVNDKCPSYFDSDKYSFGDSHEVHEVEQSAKEETMKNCIDFYTSEKIDERAQVRLSEYERQFNMPHPNPAEVREGVMAEEGRAARRAAERTCENIQYNGNPSRTPMRTAEFLRFVPPGKRRAIGYYYYMDDTGHMGYSMPFPIDDGVHAGNEKKYGKEFVVRLRDLATS